MVLKTHNSDEGFTLVELGVGVAILLIISSFAVLTLRPGEMYASGRDKKRLSDISLLERMITEYYVDHEVYPAVENVVYVSTALPSGNIGPLQSPVTGWIGPGADFSTYNVKLPTDPENSLTYRYTYTFYETTFELNAVLETSPEVMSGDGGDDASIYEVGNDLTLL
jgi:prepilin-type N-terminal cleavage/methylation domain-containing protein